MLEQLTIYTGMPIHVDMYKTEFEIATQQKQCIACLAFFKAGTEYYPHTWGPVCPECADKVGLTEVD